MTGVQTCALPIWILFSTLSSVRSEPVAVFKSDNYSQPVLCEINGNGRTFSIGFWNDVFLFPSVLPQTVDVFPGYSHWINLKNISALTFEDDNVFISTGAGRVYCHTLSLPSGSRSIELQSRHCVLDPEDSIRRIACHPSKKILATANSNNQVKLWRYDEPFLKYLTRR